MVVTLFLLSNGLMIYFICLFLRFFVYLFTYLFIFFFFHVLVPLAVANPETLTGCTNHLDLIAQNQPRSPRCTSRPRQGLCRVVDLHQGGLEAAAGGQAKRRHCLLQGLPRPGHPE